MRPVRTVWLVCAALSLGCPGSSPNGRVAEDSKTPECSAELTQALRATKRELGFAFEVADSDGAALIDNGMVAKRYARDGVTVSLEFGLDPGEAGCSLVAYKMTRSEPGRTTTTGTQGRVPLTHCTCTAPES